MDPALVTYGDRLAHALTLAEKTRGDLAAQLEITTQAIGQCINGHTDSLKAHHSAKAARFLRVDHTWLALGEGVPRPKSLRSPMAMDIAKLFDEETPDALRDKLHAQVTGLIEFGATAARQPKAQPDSLPTAPPVPQK
jgi:hypothetical protein